MGNFIKKETRNRIINVPPEQLVPAPRSAPRDLSILLHIQQASLFLHRLHEVTSFSPGSAMDM